MNDIAYYFDRIAEEFNGYYTGKRPSWIQELGYRVFRGPGLKRRFADTIRIIGSCNGATILDIGCGPGVYMQYFSKEGAHVIGIDISAKMIELARKNMSAAGIKEIEFICGDFFEKQFTGVYDHAIAIGLFDYVAPSHRDEYLGKMATLAKRKIVATFPKMFVIQMPIRRLLFLMKRQPVFFYTSGMIRAMAARHDLKVILHNSGPIWTAEFVKRET